MNRFTAVVLVGFALLVVVLAAAQLSVFRHAQPAPDSIEYFEVADQIARVGYGHAMSLHWSPLYPVYLLAARKIAALPIEHELAVTAAADAVLLVALCAIVASVFMSLGRLCFHDREASARAWLAYACGLVIYFAFAVLRVGLRMPDALVTCMTVLTIWAWSHAIARRLDLRWSLIAGLFSGIAFLTRGNLLHWSLVAAVVAVVLAPGVTGARRLMAYGVFALGLLSCVGPQIYVVSSARGQFTFGESGKTVFAETYGAVWPHGQAWPVRLSDGDVRMFTETRDLNFPGFYEPGREYDDATIPFRLSKTVLTVIRSMHATLFGYWSPSFALMWPLCWALWPAWAFGTALFGGIGDRNGTPNDHLLRRRLSWFLMLAGAAGVSMHMLSFSLGYYLPPYLIPLLLGLYLAVLDNRPDDAASRRQRQRAGWIVALGFAVTTAMTTAGYLRRSDARARIGAVADANAIAEALSAFPAQGSERRRVAVAGQWLGVYGIRLSDSELIADIPNPAILHDPVRGMDAIRALRKQGIVALLIPRSEAQPDDALRWRAVTSGWAIADVRETSEESTRP
jgi:4-amino-4-deoxy-L-arabinose transferase-like glycosyltransferase